MYRPVSPAPGFFARWRESWARLLAPLTLWIFVSVSLRYGYFGDFRMELGPSSSQLIKANSLFIDHVEVRNDDNKGVVLYAFSEKPELKLETNWNVSKYLIVGSYDRKRFSLWLNKGSRFYMRWETQNSTLNQLEVIMLKGERNYELLLPKWESFPNSSIVGEPITGKEAEYFIEEDEKYYIDIVNNNRRSIIMKMNVNASSKMYDVSQANEVCSTTKGSCRLGLRFPNTQYFVLTTPVNGDIARWNVEFSFVARIVTYIAILGFFVIIIYLILMYLGVCDGDGPVIQTVSREVTETEPIVIQSKPNVTYGTCEEDDEESGSSSSSSDELYDEKLCIICYDDQRNCFFVPCGHCATCYDCAQRIMEGENKVCPICRRFIHKVRRLFNS